MSQNEKSIKIDSKIHKKLSDYVILVKENTNEKINNKTFVTSIITNYLEPKILNNNSITLEKPLYFNMNELIINGEVECVDEVDFTNFDDIFELVKIPNNLDVFSQKTLSYCYNDLEYLHKGVFIFTDYINSKFNGNVKINYGKPFVDAIIDYIIIVFSYNYKNNSVKLHKIPQSTLKYFDKNELIKYMQILEKRARFTIPKFAWRQAVYISKIVGYLENNSEKLLIDINDFKYFYPFKYKTNDIISTDFIIKYFNENTKKFTNQYYDEPLLIQKIMVYLTKHYDEILNGCEPKIKNKIKNFYTSYKRDFLL